MVVKHRPTQIFGGISLLLGCILFIALLRKLVVTHLAVLWPTNVLAFNVYNLGGFVLLACFAAYCVGAGLRLMNPELIKRPRFGWKKILFGLWMLYANAGTYFHLVPEGPIPLFKPSNAPEAASMKMTTALLCLVFVYLIFRGVREGFIRPKSGQDFRAQQSLESRG
jgi:hypothetical protein